MVEVITGDLTDHFAPKTKGGAGGIAPSYGSSVSPNPYVDIFGKTPAPAPWALMRENLGTAYACVTLNGDLVAKTPLRLYVKTRNGERKSLFSSNGRTKAISRHRMDRMTKALSMRDATDVEEVTSHPVLDLLQQPLKVDDNSVGMDEYGLISLTQYCQEIAGRAYWYVEPGRFKLPKALWLLAPHFTTEWPGFGPGDPIIDHYEYNAGRGMETYTPDEVVPFRMYDPATGGYTGGLSPLRAAIEQVRLARNADALTNARVQNGGMPSAMYMPSGDGAVGGPIGADEAARVQQALKMAFARAGAGGIAVGEFPGSLTPLAWPMIEIITDPRYQLTRAQIAEAFHVPITKLDRKDANRASAESGDYAHALDAGVPRCKAFAAALNSFLLPFYDDSGRFFFQFDDPAGLVDTETEYKKYTEGMKFGNLTVDEYRSWLGLEETPGGKRRQIPKTMRILDEQGEPMVDPDQAAKDNAAAQGIAEGGDLSNQAQEDDSTPSRKKRMRVRRLAMRQLGLVAEEL